MLRPVSMLDPKDNEAQTRMEEFGLGDSLFTCPISEEKADGRWLYLPEGNWFYWWTDEVFEGRMEVWAEAPIDTVPLFVKAGSVVPLHPIMQYVGEKKVEKLTLHIFHTIGERKSEIYEDAGDGYGYEDGQKMLKTFKVKGDEAGLVVEQLCDGDFDPEYSAYNIILHGLNAVEIHVDGDKVEHTSSGRTIEIKDVNKNFGMIEFKG